MTPFKVDENINSLPRSLGHSGYTRVLRMCSIGQRVPGALLSQAGHASK